MSLIKCPVCSKEISSNAISCPNCGEPIKTAAFQQRTLHLTRESKFFGAAIIMDIVLDGLLIGALKSGGEITIPISFDSHNLYARQPDSSAIRLNGGGLSTGNVGESAQIPAGSNNVEYELKCKAGLLNNTWYFEQKGS